MLDKAWKSFWPRNFPLSLGILKKKARYKAKAIKILEQLKELLKQIHARGLAVGDLSLSNILVTEDGDVRLIDLENAGKATEKYVPGLTTVGFVSRAAKTYAEADDFAWRGLPTIFSCRSFQSLIWRRI